MLMAGFFFTQRKKAHFKGWYVATFVIAYMPFRFAWDFLRAVDARYAGLTPGQWIGIVLFGLCIWLVVVGSKRGDLLVPDGVAKPEMHPGGKVATPRKGA
jgi:prolipoprotein diacylglyceryltransferase